MSQEIHTSSSPSPFDLLTLSKDDSAQQHLSKETEGKTPYQNGGLQILSVHESMLPPKAEPRWEPQYGLDHIPDNVLGKAMNIAEQGLIEKIEIKAKEEKDTRVYITYCYKACEPDTYIQDSFDKAKPGIITRTLTNPIGTCDNCTCKEERCVLVVAAYIKYIQEQGIFDSVMTQRHKYRNGPDFKDEKLYFTWEPKDVEHFYHLPPALYDLGQELIDKGCVMLQPYTNENGTFHVNFKKLGHCAVKNKNGKMTGDLCAGAQDIKRALSFIKTDRQDTPNGWNLKPATACCASGYASCECQAGICPYTVAAYMQYLNAKGRSEEIVKAREYTACHPKEIYYGRSDFKFDISESDVTMMKQSIASAPQEILDKAFELLDNMEASLLLDKITENDKTYYRINYARQIKDADTIAECTNTEFEEKSGYWNGQGGLVDYANINTKSRLIRLIGCIDYLRRKGIDFTDALNKRATDIQKLQQMTGKISGLDRVYSFVRSDKTSSLACIVQGDVGSGKQPIIESIADILSQHGKIASSRYQKFTLQQMTEMLTSHKTKSGGYDALSTGYEFSVLEPRQLYVLTGLDEFLIYNGFYNKDKSYMTAGIALRHLIKTLGSFAKDTYVIVVSLSDEATESFLELNKKYKYTYGQNIVTCKNKTSDELYQEYMDELSEQIKEQITEPDAYKKRFSEFIVLNERFLPFTNSALSHYLAEYSNVEGAPVLPPDVYDKQAVANSLDDMIGMQAVKKQMQGFEAYITFQKKAKAAGIEVKQGNLHMQFLGNPGTGKTTIARIVAKMLYDIGILEENKVVEVERKDLIAQYTGQTATKTSEKIKEALGGVLFVDEAYSLYLDEHDTYGKESIATLIKAMEDYKDKLVVILAGYDKEMQDFLKANSGIESRIGYTFHFEDYTQEELTEIFRRSITKQKFEIGDGALEKVSELCGYYRRRKNFGNGRFAKKIEQQTLINHANSMGSEGWEINRITLTDIPDIRDLSAQISKEENTDISLDQIIGMDNVKDQIQKFRTKVMFEQKAKAAGAKLKHGNLHMQFLGNPGTGKTTIARIVAKELYEAGAILENKVIEVERKDLIAQYTGQTAPKTQDVIERAMGGVLFIDEAYSLAQPGDTYGQEAIATLIKAMEDHKEEFVVIFAGYEREMRDFLEVNSGIASRIGYTFTFEDYTAKDLTQIFRLKINGSGLQCTDASLVAVEKLMQYFVSVPNFGNGRFADRIVNIALELHAERLKCSMDKADELLVITEDDIPSVKYMLEHMPDGKNMINPEKIRNSQHERTAVHELGHALLVKLLAPEDSIEKITIAAEGNGALGYVSHKINGIGNYTKSELKAQICIKMAGLAAEEVFLGEYGNGGTSDLQSATAIATNMVTRFGMSATGFIYTAEPDKNNYKEINAILQEAFDLAKEHIEEYKSQLMTAKEHLLRMRTISDEEFTEIIHNHNKHVLQNS